MNANLLRDLLATATSGALTKEHLTSYAERYSANGGVEGLLSDFAVFVCREFLARRLTFDEVSNSLNRIMPTVGFESGASPLEFWEAYVGFEDFELHDDADERARPRIREVLEHIAGSLEGSGLSQGPLEVRHTPLSREDVPKELIEWLEERHYPYVRFYRTDLVNNTDKPITVVSFDGFFRRPGGPWVAENVWGRALRAKDFLDWYGGNDLTADGWLRPGGTASCRVNWHWTETPYDQPIKWVYLAVDIQGNGYVAEAVVPAHSPVKLR